MNIHLPLRSPQLFTLRAWRAGLAIGLLAGLAACGGGGGADAPADPPASTPVAPQVPPPSSAQPAGALWHDNYALDSWDGVQIASLDGLAPANVTNKKLALTPWPDGRQYVMTEWNVAGGYTDLSVVDRASGASLYALRADGYLRGALPSPTDKKLVKVVQGAGSTSEFTEFILDLDTRRARRQIALQDWFAWMPDGRFLLVNPEAGTIRIGSVDSSDEVPIGQFRLPQDRRMGPVWVSPTGKQFVVRLPHVSATGESDLWIANVDGSGLEQLTDSKRSFEALWSPDGRYIAYDTDSGRACTGTVCSGTCQLWYTTPEQRKVKGLTGTSGSGAFRVNDRQGLSGTPLGCRLLGWTP